MARDWRKAFAEFGFCQATGHGVQETDQGRKVVDRRAVQNELLDFKAFVWQWFQTGASAE